MTEIKPIVRNANGLIEGVNYILSEDGQKVDWRKMVKPEYLVPNKQSFDKQGKPAPASIDGLEDRDLLILLGGIKELARLRGFRAVNQTITSPCKDLVACACHITWFPNFETENITVTSAGAADATISNTSGFGNLFLTTIAENRAFVRCVRNFLGIKIVGQDEMTPQGVQAVEEPAQDAPKTSPAGMLASLMAQKGVSFQDLKSKLVAEKCDGAESFESTADIPADKIWGLITRLKNKK